MKKKILIILSLVFILFFSSYVGSVTNIELEFFIKDLEKEFRVLKSDISRQRVQLMEFLPHDLLNDFENFALSGINKAEILIKSSKELLANLPIGRLHSDELFEKSEKITEEVMGKLDSAVEIHGLIRDIGMKFYKGGSKQMEEHPGGYRMSMPWRGSGEKQTEKHSDEITEDKTIKELRKELNKAIKKLDSI